MIISTTLTLIAGRFGLAPTANRNASAGLKLSEKGAGLYSNDPAGKCFWGYTLIEIKQRVESEKSDFLASVADILISFRCRFHCC